MEKEISVVVPVYNGEDCIEALLKSLENQSFKDYELIIIDDCSTDKSREILDKLGYNYYKNEKNLGFTKTVNKGIRLSKGKYILMIDQDFTPEKDYLYDLWKEKKDIVSSRLYYLEEKNKIRALNIKVNLFTGKSTLVGGEKIDTGQFNDVGDINAVSGGCFLVKREVFDKIGLLDENYFLYFADIDFCYRARKKGYKIFSTKAKCFHKRESEVPMRGERLKRYLHDKKIFLKKHSPYYPLPMFLTNVKNILIK